MKKNILDYKLTVLQVNNEKRVVKIKKGMNVYLGTQIHDKNESGFSHITEIQETLKEIEEDICTIYDKSSFDIVTQSFKIVRKINIKDLETTILKNNEDFCLPVRKSITKSTANGRLNRLILIIRNSNKGEFEDINKKMEAIKIVNDFRERIGLNRTKVNFIMGNNTIGIK